MKAVIYFITLFYAFNSLATQVKIKGNTKTHKDVILSEINDLLSGPGHIKEIKRRLWNLRIFSKVNVRQKENVLYIDVEERWTTIPIFKVSGGGGSSYLAAGLYDINSFGKNLEIGAQYESLNSRLAGVVWFRKPQFLMDRSLKVGMDIWNINRVRFFYDEDGEDNGAFTLKRSRINSFIEKSFNNNFITLNLSFDFHFDETSEFGLSDKLKEQNQKNNFLTNEKITSRWYSAFLSVGTLNYKNYLIDGKSIDIKSSLISIEHDFYSESEVKLNYYKLFKNNHNFAYQLKFKETNSPIIQHKSFIGGLFEVRGYMDGQFYDNALIQSNIEYRADLYEHKYGVIQGAVFSDQAKEYSSLRDLNSNDEQIMLSSGVGVRLISPKIYRFVGRIDYAQTHTRFKNQGISFGVQQFF